VFSDGWEAIIASSVYAVPFVGDEADDAVADSGTTVPLLFGDAFVAEVAKAPLYLSENPTIRQGPRGDAVWPAAKLCYALHTLAQSVPFDAQLGPRMSIEEWSDLPADVPGEIVEGRLVEEEMPDYIHEVIVVWLARMLANWGDERGAIVGGSDAKFAVARSRGRKPDVSVFLSGSPRPPRRGVVRVPPDIAIEVLSLGERDERRDRVEKAEEYAAFGIRWYWIVDPESRALEIRERSSDSRYQLLLRATDGRVTGVPGCPGLELDLDALWAKTDALGREG